MHSRIRMIPASFIRALTAYKGEHIFNPYHDHCSQFDRYNAAQIRRRNLRLLIDARLEHGIDSLWIGRDLGFKGGRRTGLALTDEAHLAKSSQLWGIDLQQATKGPLCAERTAVTIWKHLSLIQEHVFMWNVFPFHPHEAANPLTNRSHTAAERDQGIIFLSLLIRMLKPKRLLAIGNDAYEVSIKHFSHLDIHKIRHPSYGGERIFSDQIHKLYQLSEKGE